MKSHECAATERKCKTCGVVKPLDGFYRKGERLFWECKECCKVRDRRNYERTKNKRLADQAKRRKEKAADIKQYMADYYRRNREAILKKCAEYRTSDEVLERERRRLAAFYEANAKEIQAKRKERLQANPDVLERYRQISRDHYRKNKPLYVAKLAKRRAAKRNATPKWASKAKINEIYKMAAHLTKQTGVKHVVDHVIPLKGKTVCGLHVETNLQVIPEKENLSKFNKLLVG